MKFEHLVEINDLRNTVLPLMTRQQLWNGLVLRAERPQLFLLQLDACTITSRTPNTLTRKLQFGAVMIHDTVHFVELKSVHYHVHRQGDIPESQLTMTIEEPAPLALFVRFQYDTGHSNAEDQENAMFNKYCQSAYIDADVEMITILRDIQSDGRLDSLLH